MRETQQKSTRTPFFQLQIPELRKCVTYAMKDKGCMVSLICQRVAYDTIWELEVFMSYLKLLCCSLLWLFKTIDSKALKSSEVSFCTHIVSSFPFLFFLLMESLPNMPLEIVNILPGRSWLCVFIYKIIFIPTVIFHMSSLKSWNACDFYSSFDNCS